MDIFKGIDLNDSFILGWTLTDSELSFELEASIWPESKHYLAPKGNEYTCYRKFSLKIINFIKCSGLLNQCDVVPSIDLDGSKDYGNIDSLIKTEQGFNIIGDFGNLVIVGGELQFKLYT